MASRVRIYKEVSNPAVQGAANDTNSNSSSSSSSSSTTTTNNKRRTSPSSDEILERISPERVLSLEQRVLNRTLQPRPAGADGNNTPQANQKAAMDKKGAAHTPTERRGRKKRTPVKSAQQRNNKREPLSGARASPLDGDSKSQDGGLAGASSQARVAGDAGPEVNSGGSSRSNSRHTVDLAGVLGSGNSRGSGSRLGMSSRPSSRSQSRDGVPSKRGDQSPGGRRAQSRSKQQQQQQQQHPRIAQVVDQGGWIRHVDSPTAAGGEDVAVVAEQQSSSSNVTTPEKLARGPVIQQQDASNGSVAASPTSASSARSRKRNSVSINSALSSKGMKKRARSDGRVSANSSRDGFSTPTCAEDVPSNQPSIKSFFVGSGGSGGGGGGGGGASSASLPISSSSSSSSSASTSSAATTRGPTPVSFAAPSSSNGGGTHNAATAGTGSSTTASSSGRGGYSHGIGDQFTRQRLEAVKAQLEAQVASCSALAGDKAHLQNTVKSLEAELAQSRAALEQYDRRQQTRLEGMTSFFESILREKIALERTKKLQEIAQQNVAVGRVIYARVGPHIQDLWCDGEDFAALYAGQKQVKLDREALEAQKRELTKLFRKARADKLQASRDGTNVAGGGATSGVAIGISSVNTSAPMIASSSSSSLLSSSSSSSSSGSPALAGAMHPPVLPGSTTGLPAQSTSLEWARLVEREECLRMAFNDVKRREAALKKEEEALQMRKKLHLLNIKRASDLAESRFSRWTHALNGQYVLVDLLGKGGFSEVWKAVDLRNFRYVACKIHQLNPAWSEAKKKNYTKHATREYKIHKGLRHERVVPLYHVFEIDTNSFATVLEYCPGPDLSVYLKENPTLSEKEARGIIIQVLSALKYLSEQKQKIIHYDLKPANILLVKPGEIKITDFGLSKIMQEDGEDSRMELTSQGAGTYWYLPPECFVVGSSARISSKVDVWSVGVIFFQMVFGKRPFGDGMSQDTIMRQGTMLQARSVKFPDGIKCSNAAKEFMLQCLQHSQERRASIEELYRHPYITQRMK